MGCGWCYIEPRDLIVLFLASCTPMILWGLGALHSLFTGFQVMPSSYLMISVNYEIHAPVDMMELNCKIPRIYFKPSYMWTGGCCCCMEEIWQSVATSAAFLASTQDIDLAAMFQCLLASLWSPLQHFLGNCVKTWPGTLVHIFIDIDLKQQLHSNLKPHLQTLGCVRPLVWGLTEVFIFLLSHWVVLYWLLEHCYAHGSTEIRMVQEEESWWINWSALSSGWCCLWQSISRNDFLKHQIRDQLSCSSSTPKATEPVENSKLWNSQWNWVQPCSSNTSASSTYLCYC
jgi:hypothetical protein